jgi:hypothetical protein
MNSLADTKITFQQSAVYIVIKHKDMRHLMLSRC